MAERRPAATGPTSFTSVQTAATPMVPAPTKRTWWLQVCWASCAIGSVLAASAEKCGTPQTQPISAPTNIATPTHRPTRWPTANSANDSRKSKPVTPPRSPPTRKYRATSLAKMRVATMQANTAETIAPQTTAASPARLSSTAAASACSPPPTLSTSAQATPSG